MVATKKSVWPEWWSQENVCFSAAVLCKCEKFKQRKLTSYLRHGSFQISFLFFFLDRQITCRWNLAVSWSFHWSSHLRYYIIIKVFVWENLCSSIQTFCFTEDVDVSHIPILTFKCHLTPAEWNQWKLKCNMTTRCFCWWKNVFWCSVRNW